MPRATRGFKARRRRKRVLKQARGFVSGRRKIWRRAVEAVHRAWAEAYRGRKEKKRRMRRLWIVRINAGTRASGLSYSRFIDGLNRSGSQLDRKVLAELAVTDPQGFGKIVESAKAALV